MREKNRLELTQPEGYIWRLLRVSTRTNGVVHAKVGQNVLKCNVYETLFQKGSDSRLKIFGAPQSDVIRPTAKHPMTRAPLVRVSWPTAISAAIKIERALSSLNSFSTDVHPEPR